jgi:hypothetical protein
MILDELAIREKMSGCDLVCKYEAGVPIYKAQLKINLQRQQQLPTITQFTLELINQGVHSQLELEEALGLEAEFVRSALVDLDMSQLIVHQVYSADTRIRTFAITEKGKQVLREMMITFSVERFTLQVDGLTSKFSRLNLDLLWDKIDLKKRGVWLLHVSPGVRPTVESLNDKLNLLVPFCGQELELSDNDKLIEVLGIERPWLMYKIVNILIFRDKITERIYLRVYEGYESIPEYDRILTKREQKGGRVIPDELLIPAVEAIPPSRLAENLRPGIEEMEQVQEQLEGFEARKTKLETSLNQNQEEAIEEPITSKTKQILELEDKLTKLSAKLKKNRPIQDGDHRELLKDALTTAKYEIIIVSPWINKYATDQDIIGLIRKAVQRGVSVSIGYGMPLRPGETKEKYLDETVAKEFKQIQKGANGEKLRVEWFGTHEKILVCDRRFCVITSFNWLSYRGDRGFRRDKGAYSENPEMIKQVADDVLKKF